MENESPLAVRAVLCVHRDAFDRLGPVLRYLAVGLVDQAVHLRVVSEDPRVDTLSLGPIQSLLHRRIGWPVKERRIGHVLQALSPQPPTVVHAMSVESYGLASAIAETFDADLVFEVTSLADCNGVARVGGQRVGRYHAISQPLANVLEAQLDIHSERIDLIHPGVRASQDISCFAQADRAATVLCMSPFERGAGVDRFIRALALLRKRECDVVAFLLGHGRQELSLRRLTRELKISSRVTFANPLGDVEQAINSADIFVHPAEDTFFTADGLQAMGAGVAVVTLANAVCDYYRHGETAIVCEKSTPEALADAIQELVSAPQEARRIATAGAEYVRTQHAMSGMADRTAAAYRRLALNRTTFAIKE
jgi:glycosyltransferase involved in cell wall biosynthesis